MGEKSCWNCIWWDGNYCTKFPWYHGHCDLIYWKPRPEVEKP